MSVPPLAGAECGFRGELGLIPTTYGAKQGYSQKRTQLHKRLPAYLAWGCFPACNPVESLQTPGYAS